MLRKLLVLAFGAAIGLGGAPAATASPVTQGAPAMSADVTLVGNRYSRGHVSRGHHRGYHRGYYNSRPRYHGRGYYRPRHGHYRGYGRGYRGRYPGSGRHYIYRPGPSHYPLSTYRQHRVK